LAARRPLEAISDWSFSLNSSEYISFDDWDTEWTMRCCGLEIGVVHFEPTDDASFWVIPYWLATVPLLGLSAWLLLSKPRNSKSKSPIESAPETVE
jgi:hypothetical protein